MLPYVSRYVIHDMDMDMDMVAYAYAHRLTVARYIIITLIIFINYKYLAMDLDFGYGICPARLGRSRCEMSRDESALDACESMLHPETPYHTAPCP